MSDRATQFAVGFYCQSENRLTIELINAADWRQAATMHSESCFVGDDGMTPDLDNVPEEIEAARAAAFDADKGFDIIELQVDDNGDIFAVEYRGEEVPEDATEEEVEAVTTNPEDEGDSFSSDRNANIGHKNVGKDTPTKK